MIKKIINYNYYFIFFQTFYLQNQNIFKKVLILYKKKFEDAKFKFEQDIVFNPKSELSYLYLSKIFNKQEKKRFRRTKFKYSNVT